MKSKILFTIAILLLLHLNLVTCYYYLATNPFNWNWSPWYRNRNVTMNGTAIHEAVSRTHLPPPVIESRSSDARAGKSFGHELNQEERGFMGTLRGVIDRIRGRTERRHQHTQPPIDPRQDDIVVPTTAAATPSARETTTTTSTPSTTSSLSFREQTAGDLDQSESNVVDATVLPPSTLPPPPPPPIPSSTIVPIEEVEIITSISVTTEEPLTASSSSTSDEQVRDTVLPLEHPQGAVTTTKVLLEPSLPTTTDRNIINLVLPGDEIVPRPRHPSSQAKSITTTADPVIGLILSREPIEEGERTTLRVEENDATSTTTSVPLVSLTTKETILESSSTTSPPLVANVSSSEVKSFVIYEETTVAPRDAETSTTSQVNREESIESVTTLMPVKISEVDLKITIDDVPPVLPSLTQRTTTEPSLDSANQLFMEKLIKLHIEQPNKPKMSISTENDALSPSTTPASYDAITEQSFSTSTSIVSNTESSIGKQYYNFVPVVLGPNDTVVEKPLPRENRKLPFGFYDNKDDAEQSNHFVSNFQDFYAETAIFNDFEMPKLNNASAVDNNFVEMGNAWYGNDNRETVK